MPIHETVGYGAIHGIVNGTYADATARGAANGFLSTDVNKIYRQLNDDSLWIVLSVSSGTPTWAAVGGGVGGLTNFSEGTDNAAPNDTKRVSWLIPSSGDTNVDVGIQPKGDGAFLIDIPDGTTSGGNKRGAYAIDLQRFRSNADDVASGDFSFTAGFSCKASTDMAFSIGHTNTADSQYSLCTGKEGHTKGLVGRRVHGNGRGSGSRGESQESTVILHVTTNDATPTVLTSTGSASIDATTQLTLSNNSALTFFGFVTAVAQAGGSVGSFKVEGALYRDATAGSTTLLGNSVTTISNTPGYAVSLAANTTLGGLTVSFTGLTATNLRVICVLYTNEVVY